MEENYNKFTRPFYTLLRMISWKGILIDRKVVGREYKMKHNSKQFLALFMAVSMADDHILHFAVPAQHGDAVGRIKNHKVFIR